MSANPTLQPAAPRPQATPPPVTPELRVVESPPRRHAVAWLLGHAAVIVVTVLFAVSLNALAAGDAVRARDLENRVEVAERRYAHLIAEVAHMETPERIRREALQLGMVPAEDPTYLFLDGAQATPVDDERGPVMGPVEGTRDGDPLKPVLSVQR